MTERNYAVVVPVYKSVETLLPLFEGVREVMTTLDASFEVIFVEDGGSPESWSALLSLKKAFPEHVVIVRLSRNFGQNSATLCGIDQTNAKRVITIDDDLQTHPSEIRKLIETMEQTGADVVYGVPPKAKTSWFRRTGGAIIKRLFNKANGGNSIGSAFRLIEGHIVERLRFHSQDHLFINQVISWYTLSVEFTEIEHQQRAEGKSGYSLWKLAGISFRLILYYSSIPLKVMVFLCVLTALAIVGMIGYYLYYQLVIQKGATIDLFMLAVLISMAIIAGSISVFGVYINRIYAARVKKPNYSIKVKL